MSFAAALLVAAAAHALAGPLAYVANEKSGTVSIIDTALDRVVGEMPAGKRPRGMALSPDGKRLYVSDQSANALHVIDTGERRIGRSIALGESPEGVSISADGLLIAAAPSASAALSAAARSAARRGPIGRASSVSGASG